MSKRISLILLTTLILLGVEATAKFSLAGRFEYDIIRIILISQQGSFMITVEVADSPIKRRRGLMRRRRLPKDAGMLFIFEDEAVRSFWMKKTWIPLDIIFVSKELEIMHIAENAVPCKRSPCEKYDSIYPAKYVVEINGGLSEEMGLAPGDHIELDLSVLSN